MRVDDKYLKYIVSIKGPVTVLLATHENSSTELAHDVEITHVFQELMQLLYAENAKKTHPCIRCGKGTYSIGKITNYGPACKSCAPYFKTPGTL